MSRSLGVKGEKPVWQTRYAAREAKCPRDTGRSIGHPRSMPDVVIEVRPASEAEAEAVTALLVAQLREHRVRTPEAKIASAVRGVLAHPGRYDLKPMMREEMLVDFKRLGGEAIEVVTGSHRPEQYALWQREALEHGFLASRGADYHGPGESPIEPGRLPALHASLSPVWSRWAH